MNTYRVYYRFNGRTHCTEVSNCESPMQARHAVAAALDGGWPQEGFSPFLAVQANHV